VALGRAKVTRRERRQDDDLEAARESLRRARETVERIQDARTDYFAAALTELLERGHRDT
jgi:hypothetical protein